MGFDLLSVGKKVSNFAHKAIGIGQKYAGTIEKIAGKVSAGARLGAMGAAAIGLEPVAAGLAAVSGAAYGGSRGAHAIGGGLDKAEEVSGVVRSGIERVDKAGKSYKKIKGAVRRVMP